MIPFEAFTSTQLLREEVVSCLEGIDFVDIGFYHVRVCGHLEAVVRLFQEILGEFDAVYESNSCFCFLFCKGFPSVEAMCLFWLFFGQSENTSHGIDSFQVVFQVLFHSMGKNSRS